ncbi:hypothetical protein [Devosia sp.]|uniref:hypothetical protein n=1 Tax=Devosia sp. TaxID=1871048 RepID=UPI002736BFDD|nr:hypothetical protein [Devosia sp.]MDP2782001.1 hypothetical protein [Devosia sp.]
MNSESAEKIDQHFRLVAVPALAMFIMAVVLGFFAFVIDPRLQGSVPLSEWSLLAKAMHYIAPWLTVCFAFCAGGLCANSLGGRAICFFTNRCVVISLMAAGIFTIVMVWRASFGVVDTLLTK